jgi:uncharacterized membrane protein YphA (DoxX/SURF4 family)
MAIDRQGLGLTILRICLGVFFIFEGLSKIRWFGDASILTKQLTEWAHAASQGSWNDQYLLRIALPWAAYFARLVPLGELTSGIALVIGFWTPLFAFVAFFMALNFLFASGALLTYGFLTNGYGLPVLGGTLALALSGRGGPSRPRARPSTRQTSGERG